MIRSMTGFGEAVRDVPQGQLRATVKTVNHRFFNAHLKTPSGFDRFDAEIQSWLKAFFVRGHVNLTLVVERDRTRGLDELPVLDLDRARYYRDLLATLQEELELGGQVDLPSILRFSDVFRAAEKGEGEEFEGGVIREVVEEAAREALSMREAEGARLVEDLQGRLEAMAAGLAIIEIRAPLRLVAERDRLMETIRELSQQDGVDEDRLAKEVAYLAEKWDINEELVRFRAHIDAFNKTLDDGVGEPVGKRLGFLVQEMHREANTVASKANDLEIGHASVGIREEIERLREQLENVE